MKSLIRNVNGIFGNNVPLTGIDRPIGSRDKFVTLTNRTGTENTTETRPKSSNSVLVINRSNPVITGLEEVLENRTTTELFRFNKAMDY